MQSFGNHESGGLTCLRERIGACRACPRLGEFLRDCRDRYPEHWASPVPGYGDPEAGLYILGLAPGYHGANRHGRVFTGDSSGRWLWGALHELGVCSHPDSTSGEQPLELNGVYVGNAVRCCPPQNRPTPAELQNCRIHLRNELDALPSVRVVLCLGRLAHESTLRLHGLRLAEFPFAHGAVHAVPHGTLVDSYHPSRQNTNTGVLTWKMWTQVLRQALALTGNSG